MSKINITIFGLNGTLAGPTLDALESPKFVDKVNFPIKVVSRKPQQLTTKIHYITSDLSNTAELASQLEGTNVFIELLTSSKELFDAVEKVAAIVKPQLFIPSQFGCEMSKVSEYIPDFFPYELQHSENLRSLGIKTVDIVTSFFTSPVYLHEVVAHVGIDTKDESYTVRGDINQNFAVTTLEDVANTISAVATHSSPSSIPNTLRIFSETITVKKVIDTYEKNHNVKLKTKAAHTARESLEEISGKKFDPSEFLETIHIILSQGLDKGTSYIQHEREFINPRESVWKWGKFDN